MARRIPILIIIDCEPDPRQPRLEAPDRWLGFENLFDFLSGQRQRISDATGRTARFSWFWRMDPQIEVAHGSARWVGRELSSSDHAGRETWRRNGPPCSRLAMG